MIQGETGVVVAGSRVGEIARAVNELLDHPAQMVEMGKAGRAWTQERWSWQIWGERFREVLLSD